ncbi:hypothetical protein [Providencia hangzhouensis]|uniref:hypothetical protein n=1 Tax=Providencia hangzhouensis TaxID=3031799 RepID=UPI0034DD82F6
MLKPTYVSLRGKSVEEKLKARGYDDVIINENGGLDYSKSKALYHNPDRLKPDGTPVEPIVEPTCSILMILKLQIWLDLDKINTYCRWGTLSLAPPR